MRFSRPSRRPTRGLLDRRAIRSAMMIPGVQPLHPATVQWEIEQGGLVQPADREMFQFCLQISEEPTQASNPDPRHRLRDALFAITGDDIDELVHPFLIRACGAFFDQGVAYWPMPNRELGFYRSSRALWMRKGALLPQHLDELTNEFRRQADAGFTAVDAVCSALQQLHVAPHEWEAAITAELLALPGWAGLMSRLEQEPELAPHDVLPCSLMDFLAVRLTLTVVAAVSVAGGAERLPRASDSVVSGAVDEARRYVNAAELFQVARILRIPSERLQSDIQTTLFLQREVRAFDSIERRRLWHLAYERRHERIILGPLSAHCRGQRIEPAETRPKAQVFFCIDEREESFRRHLEEIAPKYETLSAADFGVAVDYKGIDDADAVPLCPVVVKPQHAVREQPVDGIAICMSVVEPCERSGHEWFGTPGSHRELSFEAH